MRFRGDVRACRDDREQLRAKVKLLPRAGRSIMQSRRARGQWMHVAAFLGARGDSATTCASVRKDVPLRSSISPFDDRALKVLRLTSLHALHTYTSHIRLRRVTRSHRDRARINSGFDIPLTSYANSRLPRVRRVEGTNGRNFNEEDSET